MRLTCSQKDLARALLITNKAVNVTNTLPVLNNVLLRAEGKKLSFAATNLEIAIDYWIEASIKNEGEITIPSRLLTNYINYLKDETIHLSMEEGGVVLIKTKDSNTKIKGIPSSEFPPIPALEKEGGCILFAKELKQAIHQVVFAASLNTTRPILSGVYIHIQKDDLIMVATDSYRLAEKKIKVKKSEGDIQCIVPARTLMEVANILDFNSGEDETIEIIISQNQILLMVDKIRITSRLIEGQFPNYQQIIPKALKTHLYFNVEELSLVLKRINIFAKENSNKVIFKIDPEGVTITTDSTQYGEGEIQLKPKTEGPPGEIALNSQYLLDVLNNIKTREVIFEIGEKTNPVLIHSPQPTDYLHIIMPLKI